MADSVVSRFGCYTNSTDVTVGRDNARLRKQQVLGSNPSVGSSSPYSRVKSAVDGISAGGVPITMAISRWSVSSMVRGSPGLSLPST